MTLREARKMLEEMSFVNMGGSKHDDYVHKDGRQLPMPRGKNSAHVYGYLANKIKNWYAGKEQGKTSQRSRRQQP